VPELRFSQADFKKGALGLRDVLHDFCRWLASLLKGNAQRAPRMWASAGAPGQEH